MTEKRHTCVICKKKRYESMMVPVFEVSWACFRECKSHSDIGLMRHILELNSEFTILGLDYLTKTTSGRLFK